MRPTRLVLALDLLAVALVVTALAMAAAVPLAARGALGPRAAAFVIVAAGALFVLGAAALLFRAIGRPVDRILDAAGRLGGGERELPLLGPPDEPTGLGLSRAAVAFERAASALTDERARLRAKVAEVEAANRALAAAHETLARSERLATVGRLASGIAHEVGNPLGAITGFADLALARIRSGASAEAADLVSRMATEATRIDRIVRELLDFARPTPAACGPVQLRAALDGALRLARVQPRFRDVEVAIDVPQDLPPVLADEGRLAQVLLNLLLNAGDAMEGRGALRIAAARAAGGVEVVVSDRGPGIAPEDLPRVFDPFFTTKAPGAGTGLGLAMCHRIVESFGGTIRAANAPEGGAVFTVALAAAEAGV